MRAPLVTLYLRSLGRLRRRVRELEFERNEALDLSASLFADVWDLEQENEVLKARVAVLADLADPAARAFSAAVLKDIERLDEMEA